MDDMPAHHPPTNMDESMLAALTLAQKLIDVVGVEGHRLSDSGLAHDAVEGIVQHGTMIALARVCQITGAADEETWSRVFCARLRDIAAFFSRRPI